MNYQELQNKLKKFKSEGLTDIRLNASKAELQAEYDRLTDNASEGTVSSPETQESEKLINHEVLKVENNEEEYSHPDHEISDLLENAYKEVEDDSNNVTFPSRSNFNSLFFVVLIVISIIGLIFATEKFISNVKFLSEMNKFSF